MQEMPYRADCVIPHLQDSPSERLIEIDGGAGMYFGRRRQVYWLKVIEKELEKVICPLCLPNIVDKA